MASDDQTNEPEQQKPLRVLPYAWPPDPGLVRRVLRYAQPEDPANVEPELRNRPAERSVSVGVTLMALMLIAMLGREGRPLMPGHAAGALTLGLPYLALSIMAVRWGIAGIAMARLPRVGCRNMAVMGLALSAVECLMALVVLVVVMINGT